MTELNEEIVKNLESEIDIEAENRKKYAELALQANAENKIIYQYESGEYGFVDQLTYNTCIFDGKKWVEDANKLTEFNKSTQEQIVIDNKAVIKSLIQEASLKINLIQDAIDLDISEDGDDDKLKLWCKYRVLLSRVDTNVEEMKLPEKPH